MLTLEERGAILTSHLSGGLDLTALAVSQLLDPFEEVLRTIFNQDSMFLEKLGYRTFGWSIDSFAWASFEELDRLLAFSARHEEGWIVLEDTQLQPYHPPLWQEQTLYRTSNAYMLRHVSFHTSRNVFFDYFEQLRANHSLIRFVKELDYFRLPLEEIASHWLRGETLDPKVMGWNRA